METILNIIMVIVAVFLAIYGIFTITAIFKATLVALGIDKD